MPNPLRPLIGRDLLEKLEAEIKFQNGEAEVLIPESKYVQGSVLLLQDSISSESRNDALSELEDTVIPMVWAGKVPGKSKRAKPVKIDVEPGSSPLRLKQYPIKTEAKVGLLPIIQNFLEFKILRE